MTISKAHRYISPGINWRLVSFALALLALTHCAQVPPKLLDVDYSEQLPRLQQLDNWQLEGKLGIRLPDDNGSARLSWRQHGSEFHLSLAGPLGTGRVVIEGSEQQVTLTQSGEPPLIARDAETLLYQATGWQLPVGLLSYWVRGVPAPDHAVDQQSYTAAGALEQFQQAGWTLQIKRHQWVDGLLLPGYVRAERPVNTDDGIRVVLAIHQWELDRD
ncbi:lipoprotein insertase outer membrane protein LolB [Gilvimarinus sp. SDUM040013]|uniref:Outer-membrane lipoprotein LolB n=1 Tax=Gilvimarinus gilvus TaxID=3058038 RepID=A0ABU4S510_9GAMM|nr:lipoprotein insertase outer membrane protein LolB [Gilvimarinus sp. SDUM040013]MDO3386070.1 lipoprotein insertase outer membrane protein LolB [Gilvimarinus sp. SDUM040013]MDX6850389.1 lipoprotein insertase outer membrane protein LolB [Gilvimarinus sp. SDUM040013]